MRCIKNDNNNNKWMTIIDDIKGRGSYEEWTHGIEEVAENVNFLRLGSVSRQEI